MAFLDMVIELAQASVMAFGGVIAAIGLINLNEGRTQHNPAKLTEGLTTAIGGGVIMIVGYKLIPELTSFFNI